MLKTLAQAKEYAVQKISELSDYPVDENEKILIQDALEEYFFEKIEDLIDEQEIEDRKLVSQEELEWYLFHKIPNYMTILEETTAEWLSEYLSDEE